MRREKPGMDAGAASVALIASAAMHLSIEMRQLRALRGLPLTGQVLKDIKARVIGTARRIGANMGSKMLPLAQKLQDDSQMPTVDSALLPRRGANTASLAIPPTTKPSSSSEQSKWNEAQ
jgi:hypothetical protein